ncbi:MAG TPA: hypothetical protein VFH95_13780 [Candidatus Kapabacteria bacterium]|nr:hypothetical protein [Candidatus Kapabacteria bacterium]
MKLVFITLIVLLVQNSPLRSQSFFAHDTSGTRIERIEYVIGASLVFSLADYIGYSLARVDNVNDKAPWWYRTIQASVQTGISYLLYKKFGLPSTIAFNLIWWSWGDDLAYDGWADLINPGKQSIGIWENRTGNGLRSNHITWAGWTPIGLLRPQGSLIARDALVAQAMIGLSISIAILW